MIDGFQLVFVPLLSNEIILNLLEMTKNGSLWLILIDWPDYLNNRSTKTWNQH